MSSDCLFQLHVRICRCASIISWVLLFLSMCFLSLIFFFAKGLHFKFLLAMQLLSVRQYILQSLEDLEKCLLCTQCSYIIYSQFAVSSSTYQCSCSNLLFIRHDSFFSFFRQQRRLTCVLAFPSFLIQVLLLCSSAIAVINMYLISHPKLH